MTTLFLRRAGAVLALGTMLAGIHLTETAMAQTPAPEAAGSPPENKAADPKAGERGSEPLAMESMAWLEGCWQGNVNKRDFREVWLPYRGGIMLGVSQTVMEGKTVDYEYLRLENRSDGVYYVAAPSRKPESAFKLTGASVDKEDAHTFTFSDPAREFPQRISYRRASEGWLYAELAGKVSGAERKVIYPMRRVDCEGGEFIRK